MEKKLPIWKPIKMGDRLPCQSFLRKKDGEILKLSTGAGIKVGQDAYYLPVDDVIEEIRNYPIEESEDEKIKQELIEYHKAQAFLDGKTNNKHVKFVAWLEKKGEQKPYGQREECLDCQMNYAGECKGICALKRNKQKPTEWSEQDKENLYHIDALIKDSSLEVRRQEYLSNWLKSLKERYTWRPSEEHIHWLIWVINRMPDTEKANEAEAVLRDLLEQLNKLRKE